MTIDRNTHLLDWLTYGHTHCQHGSKEWCEAYLHNARDVIAAQDVLIARLKADLAFADEQSAKLEALLDPHVKWEAAPPHPEYERPGK